MSIDWEDILDAEGEDMADAYEDSVYDAAYPENPGKTYDAFIAACSCYSVDDEIDLYDNEDDFLDDEEVTEEELAAYFGDGASGENAEAGEAGKTEPEDRTKKTPQKAVVAENAHGKEDPADPFRSCQDILSDESDGFLV